MGVTENGYVILHDFTMEADLIGRLIKYFMCFDGNHLEGNKDRDRK